MLMMKPAFWALLLVLNVLITVRDFSLVLDPETPWPVRLVSAVTGCTCLGVAFLIAWSLVGVYGNAT